MDGWFWTLVLVPRPWCKSTKSPEPRSQAQPPATAYGLQLKSPPFCHASYRPLSSSPCHLLSCPLLIPTPTCAVAHCRRRLLHLFVRGIRPPLLHRCRYPLLRLIQQLNQAHHLCGWVWGGVLCVRKRGRE